MVIPHIPEPATRLQNLQQLILWWTLRIHSTLKSAQLEQEVRQLIDHYLMEHSSLPSNSVKTILTLASPPKAPEQQEQIDAQVNPLEPSVLNITQPAETTLQSKTVPNRSLPRSAEAENSPTENRVTPQLPQEKTQKTHNNIRVSLERLDQLINLVGESVINQTRLESFQQKLENRDENLGEQLLALLDDT